MGDLCGGMILEGVCTKPFGHEPPCGLEVGGMPCEAPADHPEPCREATCVYCGHPMGEHRWTEVPDSDVHPGGDGEWVCDHCPCFDAVIGDAEPF